MFKVQSSLNRLMSSLSLVAGLSLLGGCAPAPSESTLTPSTEATESTIENKPESLVSEENTIQGDTTQENTTVSLSDSSESSTEIMSPSSDYTADMFEGYKLIEVDGGNLSGYREPNVVVDIGFGDREYWAFTNEYGQLVKVVAKKIILQDDSKEPVNSSGRYYPDEAKVPGVESKNLDEGHVIADSLGGVSNAYNITPQNSTLNRHGDQAYMEKVIREAGGCTDFLAIITYPNTTTQIPNHYSYSYTINGNVIHDEFDNVNPDEYNTNLESNASNNHTSSSSSAQAPASSNSTPDVNESASGQSQTNSNSPSNDDNPNEIYNVESSAPKESYKNCKALREVYPGGVAEGHPAYESKHDRDKDGWACE